MTNRRVRWRGGKRLETAIEMAMRHAREQLALDTQLDERMEKVGFCATNERIALALALTQPRPRAGSQKAA